MCVMGVCVSVECVVVDDDGVNECVVDVVDVVLMRCDVVMKD